MLNAPVQAGGSAGVNFVMGIGFICLGAYLTWRRLGGRRLF